MFNFYTPLKMSENQSFSEKFAGGDGNETLG